MAKNQGPYDHGYRNQGVNDLIVTINHAADKAEGHVAFQSPVSEYISLPPRLREIATNLGAARDNGNSQELGVLMAQAVQALDFNADHVHKFSVYRNDSSILNNAGYDFKPNTAKIRFNLLDLVPEIFVKHLEGVPGGYQVVAKCAKKGAILELQSTETPDVEDSWRGIGDGTFNKSRTEVRGETPTKRIYVRGRYHHNGGVGRWSTPVSIIIL